VSDNRFPDLRQAKPLLPVFSFVSTLFDQLPTPSHYHQSQIAARHTCYRQIKMWLCEESQRS